MDPRANIKKEINYMEEIPTAGETLIMSVTDVQWNAAGMHGVKLTIKGATPRPNWSRLRLIPSSSTPSSETDLHFDAIGKPPSAITPEVVTDVTIERSAMAGVYDVTVHSQSGTASTHVNYPIGDRP
jgi:hypothetical protein